MSLQDGGGSVKFIQNSGYFTKRRCTNLSALTRMKIAHACAAHTAEQNKFRLDALGVGSVLLQQVFRANAEHRCQGVQELLREGCSLPAFSRSHRSQET
ncbi:hypothetical protein ASF72_18365 [Arthrobacter sp. Leaf141]|nr:hypothetical protein ASF72_18365 [Arthrobacter sp. Leaf141]